MPTHRVKSDALELTLKHLEQQGETILTVVPETTSFLIVTTPARSNGGLEIRSDTRVDL
jgi:hypothetical protein